MMKKGGDYERNITSHFTSILNFSRKKFQIDSQHFFGARLFSRLNILSPFIQGLVGSGTVVEHLPHHQKVKGFSPALAIGTVLEHVEGRSYLMRDQYNKHKGFCLVSILKYNTVNQLMAGQNKPHCFVD
jgi:hypothetical protein